MIRSFAVALLFLALVAAPAAASDDRAPRTLREAGLLVSWPRSVIPGERFSVTITATRARQRTGRRFAIALVRVDRRGRTVAVVRRRRMRAGIFQADVPPQADRRYAVVIKTDGRRFRRALRTSAPLPPGVNPAVPPPVAEPPRGEPEPTPPARPDPCRDTVQRHPAAEATTDTPTVSRGGTFHVVVRNTGEACLMYGAGMSIERRRDDGSWEHLNGDDVYPSYGVMMPPGGSYEKSYDLRPEWEPGRYRTRENLYYEGPRNERGGMPWITVIAEFDVT